MCLLCGWPLVTVAALVAVGLMIGLPLQSRVGRGSWGPLCAVSNGVGSFASSARGTIGSGVNAPGGAIRSGVQDVGSGVQIGSEFITSDAGTAS